MPACPRRRRPETDGLLTLVSAHVVAEGANAVAVMFAEDGKGSFVEMLARIPDGGGTDLPRKFRLHLTHVFGAARLDCLLDQLGIHRLKLVGGASELGDWIGVQPFVPHHNRTSAVQPTVRAGDIAAELLGDVGKDDGIIERSTGKDIALVCSLPTVPAGDPLLDPVIVGDEHVIRIPNDGYEMSRCGLERIAETIGKAAMLKIDAIVGKFTTLDPCSYLVGLVPSLLARWEPLKLIDATEEALEPVIA